jgi:hypothetical protein
MPRGRAEDPAQSGRLGRTRNPVNPMKPIRRRVKGRHAGRAALDYQFPLIDTGG